MEEFGPMPDDPESFPSVSRWERCGIHQGHQGYVERIQKTHKPIIFIGRIRFENPAQFIRVVSHDTGHPAAKTTKSHHKMGGKIFLQFKKFTIVDNLVDNLMNIIGKLGVVRHNVQQRLFPS